MKKKRIVANWKMNGSILLCHETVRMLARMFKAGQISKNSEIIVCPPFPFLVKIKEEFSKYLSDFLEFAGIGGQDCAEYKNGAHTGEISAEMLRDCNCKYVILGHSERRTEQGESDRVIQNKISKALEFSLIPIVCVGEPIEVFEKNETKKFLTKQLSFLKMQTKSANGNLIVAYEPRWAIGTGQACNIKIIKEMCGFIKTILPDVSILYGGSVNEKNIKSIVQTEGVDGVLIGKTTLNIESFNQMIRAVHDY